MISLEHRKLAQTILNERHSMGLRVDGQFGRLSRRAVEVAYGRDLPSKRALALVVQEEADRLGLGFGSVNDAWWGPVTEEEANEILVLRGERKNPGKRPDEAGKVCEVPEVEVKKRVRCWNPKTREMRKFYGGPGMNQGMVECPFTLKLSWDRRKTLTRFSAHEKLVPRVERVLGRVLEVYGEERIQELGLNRFGGCLNVRKKRGGSSWSTHAWGAALDWWPEVNRLRETARTARFARPEYKAWLDLWGEEGFLSLGRCYDFDWMHVQANPR